MEDPNVTFSDLIDVSNFREELKIALAHESPGPAVSSVLSSVDLDQLRLKPPITEYVLRGNRAAAEKDTNRSVKGNVDESCKLLSYRIKATEKHAWKPGEPERTAIGSSSTTEDELSIDEVFLQVAIYEAERPKKSQEFIVLGSQPLTALMERISCISDTMTTAEPLPIKAGFFFIEDTFYTMEEGAEHALVVKKFLNDHRGMWKLDFTRGDSERSAAAVRAAPSMMYETLKVAAMDRTKFENLCVRLGFPYVFVHHGDCEHLVVFRDIRSRNTTRELKFASDYPQLLHELPPIIRKCTVCELKAAAKCVVGDKYADESPAFFCSGMCILRTSISILVVTSSDFAFP